MPVVTRYLFASLVVVTLAGNFGLIAPQTLMLIPEYIFGRFEIWRLVTNLMFMGKLGFSFLMQLMFLHNHSPATEDFLDRKEGQGAYLFFVVFAAVLLNLAGGLMQVVPHPIPDLAIACRSHPTQHSALSAQPRSPSWPPVSSCPSSTFGRAASQSRRSPSCLGSSSKAVTSRGCWWLSLW
eukprot:TRINITY_DN3286_c0_g1_i6.p1 TRINITY_DN3286_c0_g1~~TRINITY_DN3286_c0_g1_i6.p1  ORF type:complete len:181 (-),score=30.21 TRINITY_DN3286_c0_g1_i6:205-747(-)